MAGGSGRTRSSSKDNKNRKRKSDVLDDQNAIEGKKVNKTSE